MTRKLKIGLGASALLTLFGVGGWSLGTLLRLQGSDLWILRGGLWLIGLVVTAAAVWFVRRRRAGPSMPVDEGREIDTSVAAVRARLGASRAAGGSGLHNLPVVLVLGPEGSAKTTTIVRSGLDPELLTGEVFRGDTIAPTRSVNAWYARKTIMVEAASRVTADASRWGRLVHHLHPRRLRAALSGGDQAPRAAVVCYSCEDFLRPGGAESVPAAARPLHARLSEVALELGIRLPVYVIFTKADRIPHFPEYVRNFSRDEVREVFGATLPLDLAAADSYAERAFKRIDRAFQRLFHSLTSKRLKFLPRENVPESAAGAYEFPREFRKVIPLATQFLVELCRPSQLEVSPVLRGFYFVGVRPVVVTDTPFETAHQASATGESIPIGATSVFNPGQARAAVAAKLAEPAALSRKVPQWLFLERLFPEVVLGDRVAIALTRGGRRVDLLRRLLLASVAAVSAVLAAGFYISYTGNRRLQASAVEAMRGVAVQRMDTDGLATLEGLQRLDLLRDELEKLARYESDGPPWRLRWGLYSGAPVYPQVRKAYFAGLDRLLLAASRDSLVTELRGLPDVPGRTSDYGQTYATLKAYLITSFRPDQSTAAFLAPVLLDHWRGARRIDAPRVDLARRQFDFYADALRRSDPYASKTDGSAVARARGFLRQFTGTEPIYRSMLAAVSAAVLPVEFARKFPNATVVRDPYVVEGPFTKDGWAAMQTAFKEVDRYFKGEAWVVGDQAPVPADRTKALEQLRAMYVKDYVNQWRSFLAAASVERFGSIQDGARKLAPLSSNQSPLLAMFSLISRNTAVDSLAVTPAFQPVHVVAPPADTAKYIGPSNEGYMNALVALQSSLEQVAKGPPEGGDAAVGQALADASQAKLATKQVANKFQIDDVGKVHIIVQRLMEAPVQNVESILQTVGPAQLNGKGRAFCAPFQQLLAKFPFNPGGAVPADLSEVSALLQPGTGALWTFVANDMGNYVVQQGPRFAEKPGTPVRISPSFIAFLNRAADFSTTLYRGEGAAPRLTFTIRPILSEAVSSLTLTIDGRPARFTRTSTAGKLISWVAGEGQEATLSGQVQGREQIIYTSHGTWAIFRLFNQAQWFPGEGYYLVEWPVRGQAEAAPVMARFEVNLAGAKPIMARDFFSGVACSGRVTR